MKHTVVVNSPWKDKLPNGTLIERCEPREEYEHLRWYKRTDGKLLFPSEKGEEDGKFVLKHNEVKNESLYKVRVENISSKETTEVVMSETMFYNGDEKTFNYTILEEIL